MNDERSPEPAGQLGATFDPAPGTVMARVRAPLVLVPVDPESFARPEPDMAGRVGLTHGMTTWRGPWDQAGGQYFFTGNHGVIEHHPGFVKGKQEPQGGAYPVVYRPTPLPWDCGTALNVTSLNANPKGS